MNRRALLFAALALAACEEGRRPELAGNRSADAANLAAPSPPDGAVAAPDAAAPATDAATAAPDAAAPAPDAATAAPDAAAPAPDAAPVPDAAAPCGPGTEAPPGGDCSARPPEEADAGAADAAPPRPPVVVEVDPGAPADLAPAPAPAPAHEPAPRARRRMNLDQLDAAMRQVSDGIGWTERRGNVDVNLFVELAATLGKPDYIQITTENLEPSALFLKFLDDAARAVCARVIERDVAAGTAVLLHDVGPDDDYDFAPEAVDANLRRLLARFHGRLVPEEAAGPTLAPWRWLFRSAAFVGGDPLLGWNAVCVGLFSHPDFYSY